MAEEVLVNGAGEILNKLISKAIDEIGLMWGVKGEMKKLEKVLSRIQDVLQDAEEKQVDDVNVRFWLRELKDVVYDADDILDEIAYESLRRKMEIQNRFKKKVWNFFTLSNPLAFRIKMAHKIKDINQKLVEIEMDKDRFKFSVNHTSVESSERSKYRETASPVDDSEIVGRGDDKTKIIDMLLESSKQDTISVIPIVGLGGLGKTTLAQLVYNDNEIQKHYDPRMWICVSNDFNVKRLVKEMIESISENKCEISSMDVMQRCLKEKLIGKRFLLLLDDMWNEKQFLEKWDTLRTFLICAGQGSKIIVTTRTSEVASIVGMLPTYYLQILPSDDCWELFERRAFSTGGVEKTHALETIGREIVKKCAGIPLAIKTLGALMHSKKREDQWLAIKNNEIWNLSDANEKIISVLKLSYDNLSSPLKRCFSYCSLFPKGHMIKKNILIQLWSAEGFLGASKGSELIANTGNEYFNTLCWNSFFQDVKENRFGEIKLCKMHDLVHDLAQSISGVECSIEMADMISKNISETRYMGFDTGKTVIFPEALYEASKLRSFYTYNIYEAGKEISNNMLLNFKLLRVLDLGYIGIKELPSSVGKLKHLRFLDLSVTDIKELPKSITRLYNLQTLRLKDCENLKALPQELWKLINLRHLRIDHLGKLNEMPKGIGQLSCLQTLPLFVVAKGDAGCAITELQHLNLLQGKLRIHNLENVRDVTYAKMANIKGKKNIHTLRLKWNREEEDDENDTRNDDLVLEALQPHSNLKGMSIIDFQGMKFPAWISNGSALSNLVEIYFYRCNKCECLSSFEWLPSLKKLYIQEMRNVKHFGGTLDDFPSNISSEKAEEETRKVVAAAFPLVEQVHLKKMPNLEAWFEPMLPCFPRLDFLIINDCPKLRMTPSSFPSLKTLNFQTNSSGIAVQSITMNLTSLTNLYIEGCSDLKSLPEELLHKNKSLHILNIISCPQFQGLLSKKDDSSDSNSSGSSSSSDVEKGMEVALESSQQHAPTIVPDVTAALEVKDLKSLDEGITALQLLYISGCPKFNVFPNTHPSLKDLSIIKSNNMFVGWLTSKLNSLTFLWVEDIPDMSFLPRGLLQNNKLLEELSICDCPQLQDFLAHEEEEEEHGLQLLECLTYLTLRGCHNLTSIDVRRFNSLRYLEIVNCRGLKSFPEGFHYLPHLEHLRIGRFSEELDSFPFPDIDHHISTLCKLEICGGSPKLKSLPHQLQHLTALNGFLIIEDFDSLIALPEWLGNLSSLEELKIWSCKNLIHLPSKEVMRCLTSLEYLEIKNCPLLNERCNKERDGEEWNKISHIPTIKIDEDFVQDLP